MTAPVLDIRNLSDGFLEVPSLSVGAVEIVALLGANGAGKSRLIETLAGLRRTEGQILLGGTPIQDLPPERRARLGLGYVPQGRRLFPGLSVEDTLLAANFEGAAARRRRLEGVLSTFPDLAERLATRAWQLSGGQQQMLAIGRALMSAPGLLILDEPSTGLAPKLAASLLASLPGIAAESAGILLAEQNARAALRVATRAYVLRDGHVAAEGPADELRREPALADLFLSG